MPLPGFVRGVFYRLRRLPPGIWICLLVVSLLGGRWLWIQASHPAHGREITEAYGSVSLFYGTPQSDQTGKRITYVATAAVGYGVFLCDTVTGKIQNVRPPWAELEGDLPELHVWPWSPDDRAFAYSDHRQLVFCDGSGGEIRSKLELPAAIADLVWISPKTVAYWDVGGQLGQLERQADGTWRKKAVAEIQSDSQVSGGAQNGATLRPHLFINAFSLTALDERTIAWGQSNCIWSLDLASGASTQLLDGSAVLPAHTQLRNFDYIRDTGQFLLNGSGDTGNSVWRFHPAAAAPGVVKVADALYDALGIEGTGGAGWVARKDNYLMVRRDAASEPIRIVPRATIDGIRVSGDGRRLFILGLIKDEAAAGIWQYDFASAKLTCVVPYGDKPSYYATKENSACTYGSLSLPSGEKLNYVIFPPDGQIPASAAPVSPGDRRHHVLGGHTRRTWPPLDPH